MIDLSNNVNGVKLKQEGDADDVDRQVFYANSEMHNFKNWAAVK
jgi:hypothetical protein